MGNDEYMATMIDYETGSIRLTPYYLNHNSMGYVLDHERPQYIKVLMPIVPLVTHGLILPLKAWVAVANINEAPPRMAGPQQE